jgi:hypothetical protein
MTLSFLNLIVSLGKTSLSKSTDDKKQMRHLFKQIFPKIFLVMCRQTEDISFIYTKRKSHTTIKFLLCY